MVVVSLTAIRRWLVLACVTALLAAVVQWGVRLSATDMVPSTQPVQRLATAGRAVAITYDAPAGDPAAVGSALSAVGVPATVFVAGAYASAHPQAILALLSSGLEVETLGWDGSDLTTQSEALLKDELHKAAQTVAADTGTPPLFLRPPAGRYDASVLNAARKSGLSVVTWTTTASGPDPSSIAQQVLANLLPGAIIRIPASPWAAEAAPAIALGLRARGYEAVTLDALLAMAEGASRVSLSGTP